MLGGFLLYFSFSAATDFTALAPAPDAGWLADAPLTTKAFSPGHGSDYWTIAVVVSGFGSIATGINILATVLCMHCPGMTLGACRCSYGSIQ